MGLNILVDAGVVETISLVVASIALVSIIVLIIIFISKSKKAPTESNIDTLVKLGELSQQLNNLSSSLNSAIKLSVSDEVNKLQEAGNKASETNNQKLERFQNNITESLNKRFDGLNKQMDDKLAEINKKVDEKLAEGFKGNNETLTQVRERLKAIDAAQQNIQKLSGDVVSLKQVLEGNQSRGQYGEYQLSMVLHNVFGDTTGCYEEQYTMKKVKDGTDVRADAVVFMPAPNKMICIDSKFPFQNYSRMFDAESQEEKDLCRKDFASAVKKHITVIKEKYIVEGKTAPEAMMFIPNDGVFAFIHHDCSDVVDYAREKRVILTSPSTLPAMLVTINMVKIEMKRAENAKEISRIIQKLTKDFEMFDREWKSLSNALSKTTESKEKLDSRVSKLTGKFESIKESDVIKLEEKNDDKVLTIEDNKDEDSN